MDTAVQVEEVTAVLSERNQVFSLSISSFYESLSGVPTPEQICLHRQLRSAEIATRRLQELVPLCQFNGLVIEAVTDNETIGSVPLLPGTMNQNGTHQASVFYMMSDYIAGIAVFSGLPGTYIVGIHDRCPGQPIQMWLKSNSVIHLKPGTGAIRGHATLSSERAQEIRIKLLRKGRVDIRMHVDIYQGKELIATAEPVIGVYVDNPKLPNQKMDVFQRENAKLSAKLIAAMHSDERSQKVAGEQGHALAIRFKKLAPQLAGCVEARRKHLDGYLQKVGQEYSQVVELGIGLDTRPFQYASVMQYWFGIELRHLCAYRNTQFSSIGGDAPNLRMVAADLFTHGWGNKLKQEGFDCTKPTLFIVEGVIHYCHLEQSKVLFEEIAAITMNKKTRIWIDHVTPDFYQQSHQDVLDFLVNISRLGEPFVFGFSKVEALTSKWKTQEQCVSTVVLGPEKADHSVYDYHLMSILSPNWESKSNVPQL